MVEQDKMDRQPRVSRIKVMSLYASSADYERRLDEDSDCLQAFEPEIVDGTQVDDAQAYQGSGPG